jgi:hypothetical protein
LIGLRPIDYRYRFEWPIAVGAFAGIERWNLATPATSEYVGLGLQWLNIMRGWDLDFEGRYGQNLARDHVLATDVQGARPESFYKVETLALFVSRHFQ